VDEERYRKTFREFEMNEKVTLNMGTVVLDMEAIDPFNVVELSPVEMGRTFGGFMTMERKGKNPIQKDFVDYLSTLSPETSGAFIMFLALKALTNDFNTRCGL